ncbi:MAG: MBL fold metallo-hydrolase [Acidobacteriota bacterium]
MIHAILPVGSLFQQNCSILGDEETREAFIVDPGAEPEVILSKVEELDLKAKGVLITHAPLAPVGAVAEVKEALGVKAWMHPGEAELYAGVGRQAGLLGLPAPRMAAIEHELREGMVLELGKLRLKILETPGHSPASVSIYISEEKRVVAGDTLLRRSIGRPVLPGGNLETLLLSIHQKLLVLPPETEVYPGHGPETTVGEEAKWNEGVKRFV